MLLAVRRRLVCLQAARITANDRLSLEVVHEVQLVRVLLSKAKLMVCVDQLDLVRYVVRADFRSLIEIDGAGFFGNVEVPLAEELISDAVDRLISRCTVEQ